MIGSIEHPLFSFGIPPDGAAWLAFALAFLVLLFPRKYLPSHRAMLVGLCGFTTFASFGYFLHYLQGAPRVIDATTYLLEARTFAEGSFSFQVPEPTASFRGRFLVPTADAENQLAPIFPPGYPALLALGVLLRIPFWIGPLIGGLLVWVTHALTFELTKRRRDALVSASLSAVCVALRYHTAETMSHGWATLLTAVSLLLTLHLRSAPKKRLAFALGLSLGLLGATRQLTGLLVASAVCVGLLSTNRKHLLKTAGFALLGLLPGAILLFAHHAAITGELLISPQTRYYDLADGPNSCFRLSLGSGCHYEHAEAVAQQGGAGLTPFWMLKNTLHRFHYHLLDVANCEPLFFVGVFTAFRVRGRRSYRALLSVLILIPFGYAFFYFAGSYPGGGARLFSEMLPLWHVLLAIGLCTLRSVRVGLFAALIGFAVHGVFPHIQLRSPHFGPPGRPIAHLTERLQEKGISPTPEEPTLVLVSTAHEFNLGHLSLPGALVARRTFDDREWLLAHNTGAPMSFSFDAQNGLKRLELPKEPPATFRLETEFDFPALEAHGVWVHPASLPWACVSRGRALALHSERGAPQRLRLEGRGVPAARYGITLQAIDQRGQCVARELSSQDLPGDVLLDSEILRGLSHIDALLLTPTHL